MDLAKQHLDIGPFARDIDPHLAFWHDTVGLRCGHMVKAGGGVQQHRFPVNGSILKINHFGGVTSVNLKGPRR